MAIAMSVSAMYLVQPVRTDRLLPPFVRAARQGLARYGSQFACEKKKVHWLHACMLVVVGWEKKKKERG